MKAAEITVLNSTSDRGKAARIRDMFATIVPHYDLVNTLMTLGLDRRWRRHSVAMAEPANAVALDIATGTGELRRPCNLRSSPGFLRATRGIAGGERACARRSACAA